MGVDNSKRPWDYKPNEVPPVLIQTLPSSLALWRKLVELEAMLTASFGVLSAQMGFADGRIHVLTGVVQNMSQTLQQAVQAATAELQAILAAITSDAATISQEVADLTAQVATLTGQLTPGAQVSQADVDALNAVQQGLAAQQSALDALAQTATPPAPAPTPDPVVNPGT